MSKMISEIHELHMHSPIGWFVTKVGQDGHEYEHWAKIQLAWTNHNRISFAL